MVSVDARHTGEPGFESLLRHFFKNLTQHLALPGPPAGQTVQHPPLYDHKPVVEPFENRWTIRYSGKVIHWTIRKVVHPCWTNSLVDNPQVDKTTIKSCTTFLQQFLNFWENYCFCLEYDVCAFQHTQPMDVGISNQNANNDLVRIKGSVVRDSEWQKSVKREMGFLSESTYW